MDFQPFCNRCSSVPEPEQKKWALPFCELLNDLYDDDLFEDMKKVRMLFYGRGSALSRAKFFHKREYVVQFYQWLVEQKVVTPEFFEEVKALKYEDVMSEEELEAFYFKSLDSALAFVRQIGRFRGFTRDDDLLLIRSVVILLWHQVDVQEMIHIYKDDIDVQKCTVLIRGAKKRTVPIEKKYVEILSRFAALDTHYGFPEKNLQTYQSSQFLFRSSRQNNLSEDSIKGYLKKFNAEAKTKGQLLSLNALKKNGICEQVFQREGSDSRSVNSIIQCVAKCNKQVACGYAKFYRRWKEKFINKGVI